MVVFDRSNDGDFRVTNPAQIADLYNKKRSYFTENTLYPYLKFSDFKSDLFPKIRNLIRSNNPNHPWLALTDEQMLEKAGLWKQDFQTGQSGYTLAAALLLGKDEVIQQILPHYKIDALVRIKDVLRYDDRLYIQTNLIEGKRLRDTIFPEVSLGSIFVHQTQKEIHHAQRRLVQKDRIWLPGLIKSRRVHTPEPVLQDSPCQLSELALLDEEARP